MALPALQTLPSSWYVREENVAERGLMEWEVMGDEVGSFMLHRRRLRGSAEGLSPSHGAQRSPGPSLLLNVLPTYAQVSHAGHF